MRIDRYKMRGVSLDPMVHDPIWTNKKEKDLMDKLERTDYAKLFSRDSQDRLKLGTYMPFQPFETKGGWQTWDWQ